MQPRREEEECNDRNKADLWFSCGTQNCIISMAVIKLRCTHLVYIFTLDVIWLSKTRKTKRSRKRDNLRCYEIHDDDIMSLGLDKIYRKSETRVKDKWKNRSEFVEIKFHRFKAIVIYFCTCALSPYTIVFITLQFNSVIQYIYAIFHFFAQIEFILKWVKKKL